MPFISTLIGKRLMFLDIEETKDFIKDFDCPEWKREQLNTEDTDYYLIFGADGADETGTRISFKFLEEEHFHALCDGKNLSSPHLTYIKKFRSLSKETLKQLLVMLAPKPENEKSNGRY